MGSLSDNRRISSREGLEVRDIRELVAKHLDVDIRRITDEAHFRYDLGADWLDRLELLILIEDQFADVEIPDDADQIEVVGDLIRCVEDARGRSRVAPTGAHAP
jgi:acyl carrier protein